MRPTNYLALGSSALLLGLLLGAWQQGWISFHTPWSSAAPSENSTNHSQKRMVTLHYWQAPSWHTETRELLWQNRPQRDLKHLVTLWLDFLSNEQLLPQKTTLQTALLDPQTQTLYLSFASELFTTQQSTYDKLMLIEGLLKTVREHQPALTHVQFLLQHQPLPDPQLDFTSAWPIAGFA